VSIRIDIPPYLQPLTDNREVVAVDGRTIGACLDHLVRQFSRMGKMLFDEKGSLHSYVGIYLNGEDAYPDELTKPVAEGDTLYILYVIGGG